MCKRRIVDPLYSIHHLVCSGLSDLKSVYPVVDRLGGAEPDERTVEAASVLIDHLLEECDRRYALYSAQSIETKDIPSLLARIIERIPHFDPANRCLKYFINLPFDGYRVAVHAVRVINQLNAADDLPLFYALENKIVNSADVSSAAAAYEVAMLYGDIANTDGLIECIKRNANPLVAEGLIATIRSVDLHDQLGAAHNNCHEFSIAS